jgi:prepilin-type N-terminal cleavage/methylation domain-containing protein
MKSKGFTIAELAIAIAILALLLFGALVPFSAQVEIRNVADTRRTLDSIREAIIGFAQANGRLPCPANGNIAFGAAGAGIEQFDGINCIAAGLGAFGVVPWATLGTPETDAWGRRFSYRVSPAFADALFNPPGTPNPTWNTLAGAYAPAAPKLAQNVAPPASPQDQAPYCDLTTALVQSSFALCTLGDIAVFTRSSAAGAAVPLAVAIPAVIVSHGKNGFGAWQPNGTQLPVAPPGSDEAANASGNTKATPAGGYQSWAFYSRSPTSEFDDIVFTISASTLIARMVAAGRLP